LLDTMVSVNIDGGHVRSATVNDPLGDHPYVEAATKSLFAPPDPDGFDRGELRELVRRGLLIDLDGKFFAAAAVDAAKTIVGSLLAENPDGFTVSQFRQAVGNSRKHALPLLGKLDSTGVTRRRDDLRIAGPRLHTTL
jgi:selenocysteine-specific elongation factor